MAHPCEDPKVRESVVNAWAALLDALGSIAILDPILDGYGTTGPASVASSPRGQANPVSNLAPGASDPVGGGYASETLSRVVETAGAALPRQSGALAIIPARPPRPRRSAPSAASAPSFADPNNPGGH